MVKFKMADHNARCLNLAASEEFQDLTANAAERQNFADFIKSVHSNLREKVRQANGNFTSVWQEHLTNSSLLEQYSKSMKALAVNHWGENNLRRIEWCKEICLEYFYHGGREKCLQKDCKRVLFNLDKHRNCKCQCEAEELQSSLNRNDHPRHPVKHDKLVLLDVGSCFNPFQAFPDIFHSLAIDLCPADKSVISCDFLFLEILKDNNISSSGNSSPSCSLIPERCSLPKDMERYIDGDKITKLPQNTFDVVVFCLLLSYLPVREQRWTCCLKAHELLKDNGLLIIITPDSSHQNKNMSMIKSWKTAVESIGFLRWKYQKDIHTHCMAFRKKIGCSEDNSKTIEGGCPEQMLYIHQELDENFELDKNASSKVYDEDECSVVEGFEVLPFS
ncbi:S-adenosylmethionine sensor upstream of mTORC1-like [Dendronephthya gigantea]|uniref:S-adenosylmethionine sensor upstream of mTORC1-like n=1 Tax=Dendronephthya gigantea TaxID=151771 RepID=UPI00106AF517|nr:S-adenosylmethionine sensor upstream of mTORC1-like [Dendronephthya gigantea]